ncbi:hypothetical protein, partial [Vibrio harveyi]|uniref:hypothetical protein n=1 Tax=Vibrio harveyi TaxID=669 RepID=UPI001E50DD85
MRENRFEALARTHNSHNTKQMISRYIDINPLTIKLAVVILTPRFGPFWTNPQSYGVIVPQCFGDLTFRTLCYPQKKESS